IDAAPVMGWQGLLKVERARECVGCTLNCIKSPALAFKVSGLNVNESSPTSTVWTAPELSAAAVGVLAADEELGLELPPLP
ncbi:MAG: hypothetical protein M1823_008364, partial [Watsoniomyces obsoletus]